MFIRRTAIAASLIAFPIAFAASAQAAPCSYFGSEPSKSICSTPPDMSASIKTAKENLHNNFSLDKALKNLQDHLSGNFK